jgi:hypothetical protein
MPLLVCAELEDPSAHTLAPLRWQPTAGRRRHEGRQTRKSKSSGADCGEFEIGINKAGRQGRQGAETGPRLSGLSCDCVERIWRHQCTQAVKRGGRENLKVENGEAAAAEPLGLRKVGSIILSTHSL